MQELIFEALTAFTNVRRVQLLRLLRSEGPLTHQAISEKLSMSSPAATRHVSKLVRRGYIILDGSGDEANYRLAKKFKTSIHASLFGIVRREWDKAALRSS